MPVPVDSVPSVPGAARSVAAIEPETRTAILDWYVATGRELSFRTTSDPYSVLVSELMAQQTQAARAAEAWIGWMRRFPTVETLADAPVADVVRAWAGLGYNRRAVLLHRAARVIVEQHGGRVPSDIAELEALPGIGPYTARAVAAIAYGIPVGAVDVNVRRVLGRLVAGGPEALEAARMQALADASVPRDHAAAWTHALMDVGQRVCKPRRPACADCPAIAWCAYAAGVRPAAAAAGSSAHHPVRRPEPPFESTNRWLRGRILDRARGAEGWTTFSEPIGDHASGAVRAAVLGLARDGLLDARDTALGPEARLPR
jgi:A/G-specific adenine glycosylase